MQYGLNTVYPVANEESASSVKQPLFSTGNESSDRKSDIIPEIFTQITCHEIFTLHSTNDLKNTSFLVSLPKYGLNFSSRSLSAR